MINFYTCLLFIFVLPSADHDEVIQEKISNAIEVKQVVDYIESNSDNQNYLTKRSIDYSEALIPNGCKLDINIKEDLKLEFPIEEYSLYSAHCIKGKYVCGSSIRETLSSHTIAENNPQYLVAYKKSTEQMIFISGNFFKSRIERYFDFKDSEQIIIFTKLKLYDISISQVKIISKNESNIELEAFSNYYMKNIKVIIPMNSRDELIIPEL